MVVKGIIMNLAARIAIFVTTVHEPSSLWPDTESHSTLTI